MALSTDSQGRGLVKQLRGRLFLAMAIVMIAFSVLAVRLYSLQIVRGQELSSRGERNFVQHQKIKHDRGIIFDRRGRILVDNRPSLDLQLTPAFLGKEHEAVETLDRLFALLRLDDEERAEIKSKVDGKRGLERFRPLIVQRDLTAEQVELIEADRAVFLLDGVEIVEGRRRVYLHGSTASHVLGYVNEIDSRLLERERARGNPLRYELGDLLGRDGIERTHEEELRGVDGFRKVVVDAKGRQLRGSYIESLLGEDVLVPSVPGHNLFLSLDLELQRTAEQALVELGRAGSVVALEVDTGAVLAMASVPEFDPNQIAGADAAAYKKSLDADELKPWINRPIQGQYAPGSTFKPITGLAALREGVVSISEKILGPGAFRLGRHTWRCHREAGHGYVDLKDALKVSCDVYFYQTANRMGIDPIAEMSRMYGLGSKTGIALRNEKSGNVPDEAYHDNVDRKTGGYQKGMSINTSIGQGALLVTPLQLAVAYVAIANGGKIYVPELVDRIESADFRVVRRFLPEVRLLDRDSKELIARGAKGAPLAIRRSEQTGAEYVEHVDGTSPLLVREFEPNLKSQAAVDPEHLEAVRRGLIAVAQEPGGTAYYRRSRVVSMAAKTGTAQVVRLGKNRIKAEKEDYWFRDHAWFASYAPAEEPKIVVVVLNEHSGHGSSKAGPIAVKVIDKYFEIEGLVAQAKGVK